MKGRIDLRVSLYRPWRLNKAPHSSKLGSYLIMWQIPSIVHNKATALALLYSVSAIFLLLVSPGGHSNCSHLESNNGESELAERASLMASLLPPHRSARIKDIHLRYNYGYGLSKRSPLPGSFLFVFSRFALDGRLLFSRLILEGGY